MTTSAKDDKKESIENLETTEATETNEQATEENTEATDPKEYTAEDMKKLEEQIANEKDKYTRLFAEFDNFRRRTAKEKLDLIKSANEKLCVSLLPVVDDFERAINSFQEDVSIETVKEGTQLIFNKLENSLEKAKLQVIEVSAGDTLDTEFHESITQIPAPSPELKGKIVDVVEKGYTIEDKVIRYAKVVIGA